MGIKRSLISTAEAVAGSMLFGMQYSSWIDKYISTCYMQHTLCHEEPLKWSQANSRPGCRMPVVALAPCWQCYGRRSRLLHPVQTGRSVFHEQHRNDSDLQPLRGANSMQSITGNPRLRRLASTIMTWSNNHTRHQLGKSLLEFLKFIFISNPLGSMTSLTQ